MWTGKGGRYLGWQYGWLFANPGQREGTMNHTKFRFATLTTTLLLGTVLIAVPAPHQDPQPAPDNTKTNQGDAARGATTADSQKMNPADRATTKKIRSAIYQDKSLSTYAHNIKIITQNGAVTLKGPVRSDDEKANIEAKAVSIAGPDHVHSELTVAPPKS
jgi:hyperosmotically inducible periplasmic protein